KDDERIAKALKLRRQHQVDQNCRKQERAQEFAAFGAQLARLTRVIEREALRKRLVRLVFKEAQRLVERNVRRDHTLNAHRVELLKFLELARFSRSAQPGNRRQRHEFALRCRDVDVGQLIGRQAFYTPNLGNDFIAPALDAEAIHVVAAEQHRQVAACLAQVYPLGTDFVAIKNHFRLRLVEFQVGVGVDELAARECLLHQLIGELGQLLRFSSGGDNQIYGEISAPGQRWRRQGDYADACDPRERPA